MIARNECVIECQFKKIEGQLEEIKGGLKEMKRLLKRQRTEQKKLKRLIVALEARQTETELELYHQASAEMLDFDKNI